MRSPGIAPAGLDDVLRLRELTATFPADGTAINIYRHNVLDTYASDTAYDDAGTARTVGTWTIADGATIGDRFTGVRIGGNDALITGTLAGGETEILVLSSGVEFGGVWRSSGWEFGADGVVQTMTGESANE